MRAAWGIERKFGSQSEGCEPMDNAMKRFSNFTLVALAGLAVTACANSGASYRPIVDGPRDAVFEQDLADCQALAEEREYLNGDTRTAMFAGAVIGGLLGWALDNSDAEDVADGALAGAAAGGLGGAAEAHGERRQIVMNCMEGRGHNIVG